MKRRHFFASLLGAGGLAAGVLAGGTPALAQSLDGLMAQGLVGERADGLLGVVRPNAGAQALIDQINARRMAEYRAIAQRNGISIEAVQGIAGRRLTVEATSGTYVQDASGWRRK